MTDASCWTAMTQSADNQANEHQQAAGAIGLTDRLASITVLDGFGEGCRGGAGREPRTFKAPKTIADAPYAKKAGDIVAPWPGWFGCSTNAEGVETCTSGDVEGGTIWAFDTDDLDMSNFGVPLLVLLYVDFLGTMGFLYAAADCSGLIDPKTGTLDLLSAAPRFSLFTPRAVNRNLRGVLRRLLGRRHRHILRRHPWHELGHHLRRVDGGSL